MHVFTPSELPTSRWFQPLLTNTLMVKVDKVSVCELDLKEYWYYYFRVEVGYYVADKRNDRNLLLCMCFVFAAKLILLHAPSPTRVSRSFLGYY